MRTLDTVAAAALATLVGVVVANGQATIPANPSSYLALTSATTARAGGTLIANSATAGSVVVPSFPISAQFRSAMSSGIRLAVNDPTSTGWGGTIVDIDWWGPTAPVFANGDRGAWSLTSGSVSGTGTAGQTNHLASFTCTLSVVNGDGVYGECAPNVGNVRIPANLSSVYWTARIDPASSTGVTGASAYMYLSVEGLQ